MKREAKPGNIYRYVSVAQVLDILFVELSWKIVFHFYLVRATFLRSTVLIGPLERYSQIL